MTDDPFDCEDCSAKVNLKGEVRHDAGCPYAAGIDSMSDMDRTWFEEHTEKSYERPFHWTEIQFLRRMHPEIPKGAECRGTVVVTSIGPGMRARTWGETFWIPRKTKGQR